MRAAAALFLAVLAMAPAPVMAQALDFPSSAALVEQRRIDAAQAKFPVGPYKDDTVPFATQSGTLQSQVWKIREPSLSTNQIAVLLRDQLQRQSYEIVLDCRDDDCGGYDFRYALDLIPEPVMHVDLGDFRYLTALNEGPEGEQDYLGLMISRTPTGVVLQLDTLVDPASATPVVAVPEPDAPASPAAPTSRSSDVESALTTEGRLSLDDLSFPTGSSELSQGQYDSLTKLAAFLKTHPDQTVALVGHTDAVGSLAANVALSKRRAGSVLERLATSYGVPRQQMEAEGVGYLSPRASNLTEEGRRTNRRVEVILTSTR